MRAVYVSETSIMKINKLSPNGNYGLTLIETTVVIVVLLALILFTFIGVEIYSQQARRAGCNLVQDKIRKLLVSESNLRDSDFQSGIDYFSDPEYADIFAEEGCVCPDAGTYTATLDPSGTRLQIFCTVHGNLLE